VIGVNQLGNPDQESAFQRLPKQFAFKDAKREYGKTDKAPKDFLNKCIFVGILTKVGRGEYEKGGVGRQAVEGDLLEDLGKFDLSGKLMSPEYDGKCFYFERLGSPVATGVRTE
jgi:hypothetical protein